MSHTSEMNVYELLYYAYQKDDDALELMMNHFDRFIWSIIHSVCHNMSRYPFTQDDAYQEARVAFGDAIETYRDDLRVPFSSYSIPVIKNRIRLLVRKHNSHGYRQLNYALPYDAPLSEQEDIMLSDILPSFCHHSNPLSMARYEETTKDAMRFMVSMNVFERSVFQYRNAGYSYKQIAQFTDTSSKRVDNTLQKIRMRWKAHYGEKN